MFKTFEESSRSKAERLIDAMDSADLRRAATKSIEPVDHLELQVKVFHQLYEMPIIPPSQAKVDFTHIPKERLAMRFGLIAEEFMELCAAMDIRADINFYYLDENEHWVRTESGVEVTAKTEFITPPEAGKVDFCYRPSGDVDIQLNHDNIDADELDVIVRERLAAAIMETDERNIIDVADATGDLKYVIQGFELEVGIPGPEVLAEIQASNLSKLGADGKVIRRADGKVLKGPNYFKANIRKVLGAYGMRLGPIGTETI